MSMAAPGTGWAERAAPDEAARHAAAAQAMVAMQQAKSQRFGNGRALHRKPIAALRATLRVHDALPAHLRHGLFAAPGSHEAWLRLSNGGTDVAADRRPDVRGFSMRVFGVDGEAALGGRTDHQDFTLIHRPAFAFADSRPFMGLVLAAARGPAGVLGWALRTYGPLKMFGALKRLQAGFAQPFSGFATEPFFSAVPLCCGPAAVRLRLLPPAGAKPHGGAADDWAADLRSQLATAPLVYRLQAQCFVDEAHTPIEDASVDWPEALAPYVTLADLMVPTQAPDATFDTLVEQAVFDPWQALAAHRPLGEVNRARKAVYYASQQARGAAA